MFNDLGNEMKSDVGHDRLLRFRQIVPALIPVSASTFWRMVKRGQFPQPFYLSPRIAVWRLSEVQAAIQQQGAGDDTK